MQLWNWTNLSMAELHGGILPNRSVAKALVPLAKGMVEEQHELHAHVIAVRAGADPNRNIHQVGLPQSGRSSHRIDTYPYRDWLHASSKLTTVMVPMARNRSMMLEQPDVNATNGTANTSGWASIRPSRTQRWQAGAAAGLALGLCQQGAVAAAGRWAPLRAANSRGPTGPLHTPFGTPGTLSELTKTH